MNTTSMTKEEIIKRLAAVEVELQKYYDKAQITDPAELKAMSARAYDSLIAERDRLNRALT
jgi:hypothetical protein